MSNFIKPVLNPVLAGLILVLFLGGSAPAAENQLPAVSATARDAFSVSPQPAPQEASGPDRGKYRVVIDSRTIADTLLGAEGMIDIRIEFASGSARLATDAKHQIAEIARALKSRKLADRKVLITGHTDAVGSATANLKLSQKRAQAVRQALIKLGVDPTRLETRGLGESQPIADNRSAAGRARNRRVTLSLIP